MRKFRILKMADGTYIPQVKYMWFFWTGINSHINFSWVRDGFVLSKKESINCCKVWSIEEAAMLLSQYIEDRDEFNKGSKIVDIIELEDK